MLGPAAWQLSATSCWPALPVLLAFNDNLTNVIKGIIMIGAVAFDMCKNAKCA